MLSHQVLSSQAEMMEDLKEIKGYLASFGGLAAMFGQAQSIMQHHDGQLLQV